jgi:hypothetical protein
LLDHFHDVWAGLLVESEVVFRHPGGKVFLMDSADLPGRWLVQHTDFELPRGRYRVLTTHSEFEEVYIIVHQLRRDRVAPGSDRDAVTGIARHGHLRGRRGEPMRWGKFHHLVDHTVARLRSADGDREKIEAAIRWYIERGDELEMSPMILWDYFAISSPGIPEKAGYCGYESEQMVAVFDRLSKDRFGRE